MLERYREENSFTKFGSLLNRSKKEGLRVERLFGSEYIHGYTAGIRMVMDTLEDIQVDMKLHKRKQNYKTYRAILDTILENRTLLREEPRAFVRCNDNAPRGFEVFIG